MRIEFAEHVAVLGITRVDVGAPAVTAALWFGAVSRDGVTVEQHTVTYSRTHRCCPVLHEPTLVLHVTRRRAAPRWRPVRRRLLVHLPALVIQARSGRVKVHVIPGEEERVGCRLAAKLRAFRTEVIQRVAELHRLENVHNTQPVSAANSRGAAALTRRAVEYKPFERLLRQDKGYGIGIDYTHLLRSANLKGKRLGRLVTSTLT